MVLIEVGPDVPSTARRAFRHYLDGRELEFPYLCDPAWEVHQQYGLRRSRRDQAQSLRVRASRILQADPFPVTPPEPEKTRSLNTVMESGLFLIDEAGVVRHSRVASPAESLPSVSKLLPLIDSLG